MPLLPNSREQLLLRSGATPSLLLDVMLPGTQLMAVMAAAEVGLFSRLSEHALDAPTLAREIGLPPLGTEALAEALVALEYLEKARGRFRLSAAARRSLPVAVLEDTARRFYTGTSRMVRDPAPDDPARWDGLRQGGAVAAQYHALMRLFTVGSVAEVAKRVPVPRGASRLLDVGGAHALYSVALCRRHPGLRAIVLDFPGALESANATLAANPDVADRIELRPFDLLREAPPDGADVVMLANVVHHLGPEANAALIGRLAQGMRRGARLAVVEQLVGGRGGPLARGVAALLILNLLASGGRAYRLQEIAAWFEAAGLTRAASHPLQSAPGSTLILGSLNRRR